MKNFFLNNKNIKIYNILNKVIYCIKRKKFYNYSFEEYLRQQIILFLIFKKGYKLSNIHVEKIFSYKKKIYKIDILIIINKYPYLIIECKSPNIKINYNNFNQILIYGKILKPKYYYLTNKIDNFIFKIKNNKIFFIKKIPKNY
ncbi:MAG: type I restriction enzyme HsdR N-terminal domain-containing protein [Candidatus Shikimatogenerans sp. JK-2022]|nr:type I restriction enzyme HsdR N-terminal domain-containing protein [Candidatus Shikimatogenerans bostrichidophilus]